MSAPRDRDRELARLFEAERREDEANAPDFRELVGRPGRHFRGPAVAPSRLALAATLAAVLVIAALVGRAASSRREASPPVAPAEPARLADWRSPTGFLLRTPGSELLERAPVLVPRPLATEATGPSPTKGVER